MYGGAFQFCAAREDLLDLDSAAGAPPIWAGHDPTGDGVWLGCRRGSGVSERRTTNRGRIRRHDRLTYALRKFWQRVMSEIKIRLAWRATSTDVIDPSVSRQVSMIDAAGCTHSLARHEANS
jgi:hypothetical protein